MEEYIKIWIKIYLFYLLLLYHIFYMKLLYKKKYFLLIYLLYKENFIYNLYKYKENIKPLESQISKIIQLNPVKFNYKTDNKPSIGLIAENVKEIYPELVVDNNEGEANSVSYTRLVSPLIECIQELNTIIDNLQKEINKLKKNG